MALSLLQDAQTRGLAAALAGMKREDVDMSAMSQTMNTNTANLYPGLQHAALGMLSPQFLAANRTAAAAFMAAQLPMSQLASTLFPHHPALFGSWPQTAMPPQVGPHSPPASPISPVLHHHTNNNNTAFPQNHHEMEPQTKKPRKISVKKDLMSPPTPYHHHAADLYSPSGPISPPSSGSSPNSQQEGPTGGAHHHNNTNKDGSSRDKSFTCKICSRSFGYKHVLQNHERTHTGEKPFECPECHKRFTRDHHLKTHMRLHTGEKPYHCSHCDRQFVQVANLRRHLRVHTGERPYTCEICDNRFSDSNQLKSHMLIHNGEKPFECERCHLKFRRRHHLMHHKCGNAAASLQSPPPTPAISPAMSDYGMCDRKSAQSVTSFVSDDVMQTVPFDAPLDLSEDGQDGRKSRVFRLPAQIAHVATDLPVQTEPEDLSMHSPRSVQSPLSSASHHDDDLDDLDDAATLYLRQQQQKLMMMDVDQYVTPLKRTIHME